MIYREAVVDVLGAGLGHTGIREVHLIKDQGLETREVPTSVYVIVMAKYNGF